MIDALYIADASHNLVYEYSNKLSLPSFKSFLPKINNVEDDALNIENPNDLKTFSFKVPLNGKYYLAIRKYHSLYFTLLCSYDSGSSPVIPHTFISRFIETLEEYFQELTSYKIETQNDIVTLILFQMLDDGIPHITDFNKIRDLVSYNSLLTKILSEAQKTTGFHHSDSKQKSFTSDIPWRREEVRYASNEMYVDVVETISLLVKPIIKRNKVEHFDSAFYSSKVDNVVENYILSGRIDGRIDFLCRLTGFPTLELSLNKVGSNVELPNLHRCIDLDVFKERRGVLSFVPPDGKSTLMKYQVDLNKLKSNKEKTSLIKLSSIDVQFLTEENSSDFEITLFPAQMINKVDYIKVEIVCATSNDSIKVSRITQGDFQNKISGKHEWMIRDLKKGVNPTFSGSVVQEKCREDDDQEKSNIGNKPPVHLKIKFCHKGQVPSGLKVESLKVVKATGLGENVKPYKGVRYSTFSGSYIIRS
ncbi:hypothetical protein KGF56_000089 [Candida oxycetoniae]|uniref:MHD domain-containing protein n=1 Tax=Candida oxycetoniae TaxID=497107 RepID=A0AAI9T1E2_9ASCO|nr:uncharacterized protein KGF56_000089 [Candida oxycetoniae]KAI3407101.2 hypothetical protein KGF56_000089 [Candida oxycetoniae]